MRVLNKAALMQVLEPKTEKVKLGKGEVIVSEIGAADYIRIWTDEAYQDKDGNTDMTKFTPALVAYCVVNEKGERVFSDDDIPALARSSHGPFHEIARVARRLNGLAGGEVKNSKPSPIESSSSGSV